MEAIRTRLGRVDFGDYDHRGRRLYRDLAGSTSFLGLVVFATTGRLLPREDVEVLDDLAVCLHVPEPRVWPLKAARIASSSGRLSDGLVAGIAAMEGAFGFRAVATAAARWIELRASLEGPTDREVALRGFLDRHGEMPLFGVFGRGADERIPAVRATIARHGRAERPFWARAEEAWAFALRERGIHPHAWGSVSALLLDLGLTPAEIPPLLSIVLQSSYVAHAQEGAELRSPALRRLPAEAVRYVGAPPRTSPRAGRR